MNKFGEKKDDDSDSGNSELLLINLDKGQVIQEKRAFNETPIHPRKCSLVISQFLYLLSRGDTFSSNEATDIFFAATKLFQSKDMPLRRLMYLFLKEFSTITRDAIIITSSLTKDIQTNHEFYKANSIRILSKITDSSLLPQIERYFVQSIVSKDPQVASAALVSSIHLLKTSPETVKRWTNEVQESLVHNKSNMVQYHALALQHRIKSNDRLSVSKLVNNLIKQQSVKSPYAQAYLIRCAVEVIEETRTEDRIYYEYIESCLRSKNEMVAYEAARALCSLKGASSKEITSAVGILQMFLCSTKSTLRFAAVRTLNKLAQTMPSAVTPCNLDMENLISDSNRSIATLAITTLLQVGNESNVERLIKQIANFLGDINDEFKIVVVQAITNLSVKFPKKYRHLITFLNKILRDEGTLQLKQSTLDAILLVVNNIPESKEIALSELCEFIEDCEFPDLSVQILNLLGQEGPLTSSPSKYIRYIYNRVLLDSGIIRAAAVTSIAKFGLLYEPMREKVIILLKRCLLDEDDEVRDRATLYVQLLINGENKLLERVLIDDLPVPTVNLQRSLESYLAQGDTSDAFDIGRVSTVVESLPSPTLVGKSQPGAASNLTSSPTNTPSLSGNQSIGLENNDIAKLNQIFPDYGKVLKSCELIELTESESEYVVSCTKHIYQENIVFQFNVTNTVQGQRLDNVTVRMLPADKSLVKPIGSVSIDQLPCDDTQSCYYSIGYNPENGYPITAFNNVLKFKAVDVDDKGEEISSLDDTFQLEKLEIVPRDFIQKTFISNFSEEWSKNPDESCKSVFQLQGVKLPAAVKEITQTLGMSPLDKSEQLPTGATQHTLFLAGKAIHSNVLVLARVRAKPDNSGSNTNVELIVKSANQDFSKFISTSFD